MNTAKLSLAIALTSILTGLLVPSPMLVGFLRPKPLDGALFEQLLFGATLFKVGLIVLGLFAVTLTRTPAWKVHIQGETTSASPRRNSILVIIAAILLLATALRLYGLNSGLWLDEILTFVNYARMPFGEIITTYASENQHFLYSLLAHGSFRIFGESAWSLRLPAALFGVASIWALYLLGRQVGSAREALLSAALLTVSYHHIWFSQNARGYTGLLFWTILGSWSFLRALREPRPERWWLYAISTALGIYTHITMVFVTIAHFLMYLSTHLSRRKERCSSRWVGFLHGFCLAGLLSFQLHALVLPQIISGIARTESVVITWRRPLWTVVEIIKGMELSFTGAIVAVAALMIFSAGLYSFSRTHPEVIQLLILPSFIGTAVVLAMGHHLWPRFYFFAFGFATLVLSRGIFFLGQLVTQLLHLTPSQSSWIVTGMGTALVFLSMASVPSVYAPKQDYLGALAFVEKNKQPGDAVVTAGLATFPYKSLYKVGWDSVESLEALNSIRSSAKRTWLLYTLPPVLEAVNPEIMASIQQDFKVVKKFPGTLREGTIFVCSSITAPSSSPTIKAQTRTLYKQRLPRQPEPAQGT